MKNLFKLIIKKKYYKSSSALPLKKRKSILSIKSIKSENSNLLQITKEETLLYIFNTIKFNNNINPNDITIDLNDEHNKNNERDSISRISDLIERNSEPNIRFSDLLSEKTIEPKNTEISNKFDNIIPFPSDSNNVEFKPNGGYFQNNKGKSKLNKNNSIKLKSNIKSINYNKNKDKNHKNIKNNFSGDHSFQRCLIDEIIPNINNIENGKNNNSEKKLVK